MNMARQIRFGLSFIIHDFCGIDVKQLRYMLLLLKYYIKFRFAALTLDNSVPTWEHIWERMKHKRYIVSGSWEYFAT